MDAAPALPRSGRTRGFCLGTAANCPCGNGNSGGGCASSANSSGAFLYGYGFASAASDTVDLTVNSGVPSAAILFFQGTSRINLGAGAHFGDGLLCVGGTSIRLGVTQTNSLGETTFGHGAASTPSISVAGFVSPGDIRHYQGWYRDNAAFCQPELYNLTNGLTVTWTF